MIQRSPSPWFSAAWIARYLTMIYALASSNDALLLYAALTFFPLEGVALLVNNGDRDTLSELWTWVLRKLSKHTDPARGWNWLAVIFAVFESGVFRMLVSEGFPALYADVMAGALAAMLHAHWLRPDIHG